MNLRFLTSPFLSQNNSSKKSLSFFGRTFTVAVFLIFTVIGCGESTPDTSTNDGNISATTIADTCNCSDLNIDSLGIHLLDTSLYTGICISYYAETNDKYIEKNILQGKLHGKVIYYDKTGAMLFEEVYENGKQKRNGTLDETLRCDCAELQLVETSDPIVPMLAKLDDIPFTGTCEKYYKDSDQLYMESDYKNGYLEGRIIYYNRDGSTILIEKYSSGQLIGTVN